jgi:hypothetical protein
MKWDNNYRYDDDNDSVNLIPFSIYLRAEINSLIGKLQHHQEYKNNNKRQQIEGQNKTTDINYCNLNLKINYINSRGISSCSTVTAGATDYRNITHCLGFRVES